MEFGLNVNTLEEKTKIIKANLSFIKERIERVAPDKKIRIVAITKYVDASWCRALIESGLTELGENRILEGISKYGLLRAEGLNFNAHMVGTIQSNKAGKIPGNFDFVQSLDRKKIAEILNRKSSELGLSLPVLIEVNIDREEQKSGSMPEDVLALAEFVEGCDALKLRGLMCIPSAPTNAIDAEYERTTRDAFSRTYKLFDEMRTQFGSEIDTLSMGMSLDFEWALLEGANMIRLGRILYLPQGQRL